MWHGSPAFGTGPANGNAHVARVPRATQRHHILQIRSVRFGVFIFIPFLFTGSSTTHGPSDHNHAERTCPFSANRARLCCKLRFARAFRCLTGRDSACGTCKGKIVQGAVDYGSYSAATLTEMEKRAGMALFCCAVPLSELVIECREIGAIKDIKIKTLPCRVQKMEHVAPDVMIIYLKLPANERLQFLAGQYIIDILHEGWEAAKLLIGQRTS